MVSGPTLGCPTPDGKGASPHLQLHAPTWYYGRAACRRSHRASPSLPAAFLFSLLLCRCGPCRLSRGEGREGRSLHLVCACVLCLLMEPPGRYSWSFPGGRFLWLSRDVPGRADSCDRQAGCDCPPGPRVPGAVALLTLTFSLPRRLPEPLSDHLHRLKTGPVHLRQLSSTRSALSLGPRPGREAGETF